MHRNTSRVDLNIRRICHVSTLTVALNGSCAVAAHSVSREEISISITSGSNHYGIGCETFKLTGNEVLGDNTTCMAVNDNNVFHFIAREELHLARIDLCTQ